MKAYICSLSVNEHIFCMLKKNLSKIQSYVFYLNVCQMSLVSPSRFIIVFFFFFPCWNYRLILKKTVYLLWLFWYFLLVYSLIGIRRGFFTSIFSNWYQMCKPVNALGSVGRSTPPPHSWLVFSWLTVKHCSSTESTSFYKILSSQNMLLPVWPW